MDLASYKGLARVFRSMCVDVCVGIIHFFDCFSTPHVASLGPWNPPLHPELADGSALGTIFGAHNPDHRNFFSPRQTGPKTIG